MKAGRRPIVIVGAGAAGFTTARSLRAEGVDRPVILLGDELHLPYDRPPLSKAVLAGVNADALPGTESLAEMEIEVRLGSRAIGLDLRSASVVLADEVIAYDRLVIATGLAASRPSTGRRDIHVLRSIDDALAIREAFNSGRRLLVVGGGLLGYEIAAGGRLAGLEVVVVDRGSVPSGAMLGSLAGAMLADLHRDHGVDIRAGRTIRDWGAAGGAVELDDGSSVEADVIVAALGATPNVGWLAGTLPTVDGVACDARGRATPEIYAVGDVAHWRPLSGKRIEHRMNATSQAIAVARDLAGKSAEPLPVSWFWTDQYGVRIQVAGAVAGRPLVLAGDPEEGRFLAVYEVEGRRCGLLAWDMPRDFASARGMLFTTARDLARS